MIKKIFLSITVLFFAYHCETGKSYIKRQAPDSTYATAKQGDIIYSSSDFRMTGNRQAVVYKNWKFLRASKNSITLLYEEHYDFVKIQPDLKDELTYNLSEDFQIKIQGMVITFYGLSDKEVMYYIKSDQ